MAYSSLARVLDIDRLSHAISGLAPRPEGPIRGELRQAGELSRGETELRLEACSGAAAQQNDAGLEFLSIPRAVERSPARYV